VNTRLKISTLVCCLAGFAGSATGQLREPIAGDNNRATEARVQRADTQNLRTVELPDAAVPIRGDRTIVVPAGGQCFNTTLAASSGNSQFATLAQFKPTASGNISIVRWAGVMRQGLGTVASPFANGSTIAPTAETWLVQFYNHNPVSGLPVGQFNGLGADAGSVAGPGVNAYSATLTNVVRTQDAAQPTLVIGGVTYQLFNYEAVLTTPFAVNSANCYWLQVQNLTAGYDIDFVGSGLQWRWARSAQGNASGIQADNSGSPAAFLAADVAGLNYAFCLDILFTQTTPCNIPTGSCTQPTANCQNYGSGSDNLFSTAAGQRAADNFRVTTASNITGVCFTGYYSGQARPPADESFTINIYQDNAAASPGLPSFSFPGTLVATVNLNNAGGVGNSPYVVRAARFNTSGGVGFANFYEWSSTLASPVALAPGCYWIEIFGNSATQWLWLSDSDAPQGTAVNNGGDQFYIFRASGTDPWSRDNQITNDFDRAFCLSFAINPFNPPCPAVSTPPNGTCNNAVALTLGGGPVLGFVGPRGGGALLPPGFLALVDNTNESLVWYSFTGNGQNVTLSTCVGPGSPLPGAPANTEYDTRLHVYCAASCAGPFKSVAYSNDAAAAICPINAGAGAIGASQVTVPTVSGQTYYVAVIGDAGATGIHYISATTAALGVLTPVACADINEPPCVLPAAIVTDFNETEVCGATGTGVAANNCQTAYNLALGQRAWGTIYTLGATRDRDFYKLPDLASPTWLDITFASEGPANVFVVSNGATTCPATGDPSFTTAAGFTLAPTCATGEVQFQVNAAAGQVYVLVVPTSFDGQPCSGSRNRYTLRVTQSVVGACCTTASGTGCLVTVRDACVDDPVSLAVAQWDGSAACNASCDPNTGASTLPAGACCTSDAGCVVSIEAACASPNLWAGAGTTCTAAGVCNAAPAGRCCATSGACTIQTQQGCTALGGNFSATTGCLPNSCPLPPPTGSCCNPGTGACTVGITQAQCTTTGGTNWTAAGTCSPNVCPQPSGACCNSVDGTCSVQAGSAACTSLGGTFSYSGNGTSCSPNACPQPSLGRCCVGARCVTGVADQAACTTLIGGTAAGAVFTAGGTNCNVLTPTLDTTTPCCLADYNKTGGVGVPDIFDFLNGWFANSPNADINAGGLGVDDIFAFLTAWFAGGC
jgi:hypothetical protein